MAFEYGNLSVGGQRNYRVGFGDSALNAFANVNANSGSFLGPLAAQSSRSAAETRATSINAAGQMVQAALQGHAAVAKTTLEAAAAIGQTGTQGLFDLERQKLVLRQTKDQNRFAGIGLAAAGLGEVAAGILTPRYKPPAQAERETPDFLRRLIERQLGAGSPAAPKAA